jgi:hypothetical protein
MLLGLFSAGVVAGQSAPQPGRFRFLMLPEPRAMESARSVIPPGAQQTVLSPARETDSSPFIAPLSAAEMEAIGISPTSYAEQARRHTDQLLRTLEPEWIRAADGTVLYAVYRGDRPIYASLMIAPSLPRVFEKAIGPEIWVAAPDRNALFIFPANSPHLNDFIPDLLDRYETNPYAASCEIFAWKKGATQPRVIATFAE